MDELTKEYRAILIQVQLLLYDAQRIGTIGGKNGLIMDALNAIEGMSEMRERGGD